MVAPNEHDGQRAHGLEIAHARLRNQMLVGSTLRTTEEVVGWMCAVQSQEYALARWSVGQRAAAGAVTDADVERAIAQGTILRTHVLRPTWHFVPPADIRWMLELTRPRVHAQSAYGRRREEIDAAMLARSHAVIADALEGGRHLMRSEIAGELARAGIEAQGVRLSHIMMHAELEGLICSGAPRGKQQTYALLEERVAPAPSMTRDEALLELTRRYFTSHGPATARDFQWWSSLTAAQVRRGIELARAVLECQIVDDLTYWSVETAAERPKHPPRAHMLQMFDEYLVGYTLTRRALDLSGVAAATFQTINVRNGVLIMDSQVAGTWKRTIARDGVEVEARPYAPLDTGQFEALHAEAERHAAFLALPATMRIIGD